MGDTIKLKVEYAYIPKDAKEGAEAMYWGRGVGPDGTRYLFRAPRDDVRTMRKALEAGGPSMSICRWST